MRNPSFHPLGLRAALFATVALSLVTHTPLVAAPLAAAPVNATAQNCNGVASPQNTSTPICGEGESYFFYDPTDLWEARHKAEKDRDNKLRIASNVACKICTAGPWQNIQCGASVALGLGNDTGSSEVYQVNPDDASEWGWYVKKCWTGAYSVTCSTCPPAP